MFNRPLPPMPVRRPLTMRTLTSSDMRSHASSIVQYKIDMVDWSGKLTRPRNIFEDIIYFLRFFNNENNYNPLQASAQRAAEEAQRMLALGHFASIIDIVGEAVYYTDTVSNTIRTDAREEKAYRKSLGYDF